jgi:hypothetical protein
MFMFLLCSVYVFTLFGLMFMFLLSYIYFLISDQLDNIILLLLASYKLNSSCDVLRRQIICLYVLHCGFITRFHFVQLHWFECVLALMVVHLEFNWFA